MLGRYETQLLRAVLNDLSARVAPGLTDASAVATLGMANRLLAHVLERGGGPAPAGAAAEVSALAAEELREDALLEQAKGDSAGEGVTPDALSTYIGRWLADAKVTAINASLGGYSKRTFMLSLSAAPQLQNALVIRCDQQGGPVESRSADEWAILKLMHRHGLPVAEPLWADPAFPFGGTAIAMRRIAGESAYDATGSILGPRAPAAARELARLLAKVHAVPVDELDLAPALRGIGLGEHVERMVRGFQAQWQRHRSQASPVLEAAFAWLLEHIPQDRSTPAIVHGDASLRNLLLDGDTASGLLDWELWHVGDPNEDLAYCRPEIEQLMPWEEFLTLYRAHGGGDFSPLAGAFYGLFGAVRNAVFGASCIHGIEHSARPETRFAFAAIYLSRKLIPVVAQQLATLKSGHVG